MVDQTVSNENAEIEMAATRFHIQRNNAAL